MVWFSLVFSDFRFFLLFTLYDPRLPLPPLNKHLLKLLSPFSLSTIRSLSALFLPGELLRGYGCPFQSP